MMDGTQAKNKLDGETYAVKKIKFSTTNSGKVEKVFTEWLTIQRREIELTVHWQVLREVKALAKVDHANIVRHVPS